MIDLIKFENFDEFILRKKALRVYYIFLSYKEKRAYKNYIYSLPYKENVKDIIWNYLNEANDEYICSMEMNELERLYARNKNSIEL